MKVPFLDLKLQYKEVGAEISRRFQQVFKTTSFVLGGEVEQFEHDFARYIGTKYCVALNSGTSALHLALLAHGIGEGDEVITVPNTFIATAEAISYTGARPVFVDVDPGTLLMAPENLEKAITPQTRAIIPVHLFGQPCKIGSIKEIADSKGIIIIEDACQAHGAEYDSNRVGSFGSCSAFSFYPGKNLGAYGEGGALVTDNDDVRKRAIALRDHGQTNKHHHEYIGYNYRMDGFQGAVLNVKLQWLDRWSKLRRQNAGIYRKYLANTPVKFVEEYPQAKGVYHLMVIRVQKRDKLRQFLSDMGVQTGIHYPTPIHLQHAFKFMGRSRGEYPNCEQGCDESISLPMYPELLENQIQYVCHCIKEFYKQQPEDERSYELPEPKPRLELEEA